MTDHDHLDELASAHLDGVTTPEEAGRVEAEPELQARVEALRAVRAALQAPPPVNADRREQAIAAALDAYDEGSTTATVTPLTAVVARRGPSARSLRLLGAAAAVALLAALVPIISSLSSSSNDDKAAVAADQERQDSAGDAASGGTSGAESTPTPAADAGITTTVAPLATDSAARAPIELGDYDSLSALADAAIDASARNDQGALYSHATTPDPCGDSLRSSLPADTTVELAGTAILRDERVSFVVTPDEVVVAGGDCTDILRQDR